ncbi:threonylcarbamoyl-AMP synthase-like [Corticium candelabrum]|uniref:threonylcarbamoyl-AMP synthase-like n=1 Tax=Corticium candelabrum TaxID=121492 RepID=UPI002E26604B|nr:threonylcarbamoyl-AMP synthase-like [Corticium candelabrum]
MTELSSPVRISLQENNDVLSDDIEKAGQILTRGGTIAIPTDTIYGVASLAQSTEGVQKLYEMKQRDPEKPLAICVGDVEDISRWAYVPDDNLLRDLLPGAVTVVLRRKPALNPELNPGLTSIGVRIPSHPFVRKLAQFCKQPLALTSANTSTKPSTLAVNEFQELWPKLDLIVDGGTIRNDSRLGSTVVDISEANQFRIIRRGRVYEATTQLLKETYGFREVQ